MPPNVDAHRPAAWAGRVNGGVGGGGDGGEGEAGHAGRVVGLRARDGGGIGRRQRSYSGSSTQNPSID